MFSVRRIAHRRVAALSGLAAVILFLINTSWLAAPVGERPRLFAHRALGQDFEREGLTGETCTASRMLPSEHRFLENTLPAIAAAFEFGADVVEFDVHRTTDGRFAVFHDWTVDCRTEGTGVTREHTLEELQRLDVGYGYTADGTTWPFRGEGAGMMPSLTEVLTAFPDRDFMIDIKSNDASEGALLAERIDELAANRSGAVMIYGGGRPVEAFLERLPETQSITRPRLESCLMRYVALGWTGWMSAACERSIIMVPANIAPWLWGWPNRFLRRMDALGSSVVLVGDYGGEGFSRGFDDPERARRLPDQYAGGIWTDRIDLLAPALLNR